MIYKIFGLLLWVGSIMQASNPIHKKTLIDTLQKQPHPFEYELDIKVIPSKNTNAPVMICAHGYGHSNCIADVLNASRILHDYHLVSFNFPDYECLAKKYDYKKSSFGTIDEILPLLYTLKRCIIDAGARIVHLYGFSAGGGALINLLAVLYGSSYDAQLQKIGIEASKKQQILKALQEGWIILDCPLKSMDEIVDLRGKDPELIFLAGQYKKNNMCPIDAIELLRGINVNIIIHFQKPDEILGNRDDQLFIERVQKANHGKTEVIIGTEGGHNAYHASLWKWYARVK